MLNDEEVVVFEAHLISNDPDDKGRKFAFEYSLTSNTIMILEGKNPNLGIRGGKFLQKSQMTNPITGKIFESTDFYVGALVNVVGRRFELTSAPEHSLCTMEAHPDKFPLSDLNECVSHLSDLTKKLKIDISSQFQKFDKDKMGKIDQEAADIVFEMFLPDFTKQEAITLSRRFSENLQFDYMLLLRYL